MIVETPPLFILKRSVLSTKEGQGKHLQELSRLLVWNRPDVLLLDDVGSAYFRRSENTRMVIDSIVALASGYGIAVRPVAKEEVFKHFDVPDTMSKNEIAWLVAEFLQDPSISKLVPAKRRLWEAEPHWMPMFEALALVLTVLKAK